MNEFKRALIKIELQKKYGKVFNFIVFDNGDVTFALKKELNYYDKEYLELPKKEDVIKIMNYKKNNNIEVKTILVKEDFMKDLEINCNGEKLVVESCYFNMDLKINNVGDLVLSDIINVYGDLQINANVISCLGGVLTCNGITEINANKMTLTCSNIILSDISELKVRDYLHFLLTYMTCINSSCILESNKVAIEKSTIDSENLIIKSNNLEFKGSRIEVSNEIVIDSKNIDSDNNKIVSNKLTVNNKNNNGLSDVSANSIIYNNEDVTYMADRKLFETRKRLLEVLRNIKDECEANKEAIIEEKTNEIQNTPINKVKKL